MKILHLTDFHFNEDSKSIIEQNLIIEAIIEKLNTEKLDIDLVLFSGDLVQNGNTRSIIDAAKKTLLDKIVENSSIPNNKVFICSGNHESHQNQELPAIKTEIDKIKDVKTLDLFISHTGQLEASLANFKNYLEFRSDFYLEHKIFEENQDVIKELYSVHKRKIDDIEIGIVTINSAWRSYDSSKDKGQLLYPISLLKEAASLVKDCKIKIFVLHHCLSDFKEFIQSEMEDIIYSDFHLLFSGHYHKHKASTHINGDEGIFCDVSPASLSLNNKHTTIGFTVVDVDVETFEVEVCIYNYNSLNNSFFLFNSIKSEIPFNHIKREQNELRKTIRKRYKESIEEANCIFLSTNESTSDKTFLNLFTNPILKTKPKSEFTGTRRDTESIEYESLLLDEISYLLYGNDKSGKTSILWKLKLDVLRNYTQFQAIPLYLDCWAYNNSNKEIDIVGELYKLLEVNRGKVIELLGKYKLILLLDNFDFSFTEVNKQLKEFVSLHDNVKIIACIPQKISSPYDLPEFITENYNKLFIHEISKTEIRVLAQKWVTIPEVRQEIIIEKIIQITSQFNMPTNYWTVSLFLWIFEKTNDANLHNNFELIQLYIDNLLERKNIALGKSLNLDYYDFKSYLGSLAYELLVNHSKNNYAASYTDIINFTDKYRNINRKIVARVEDIVNFISQKGILKLVDSERYTFRLNGVFEYFLAYHMNENDDFKAYILKDDHVYLSFANEFELYSGFNKRDKDFIVSIFSKTKDIFKSLSSKPDFKEIDRKLLLAMGEVFNLTLSAQQLAISTKSVLNPMEQDQFIDTIAPTVNIEEEVKLKRYYDKIDTTSENLEKALFILCRVFRNTNIQDLNTQDDIFDFILDAVCNIGLLVLMESEQEEMIELNNEDNFELIQKLLANFLPVMIEVFLFDALMQNNLERIVLLKIEELENEKESNQLKLFILYFLIIDLDVKKRKTYIEKIMKIGSMGIIKQSILIKLCSYLMLKSYNDATFEKYIREKIKEQNIIIDSKIDINQLERDLERKTKILKLKKKSD